MADNIVSSLMSLVTPNTVSQAASAFGESEGSITKALSGAIPSVLAGLVSQTGNQGIMSRIFNLLGDPAVGGNALNNVSGLLNAGQGSSGVGALASQFMSSIFGNRQGALESALSETAGIKQSSASSLLRFAAPLVMSFLAHRIHTGSLNLSGLLNLLNGQRSNIMSALPHGVSSALGVSNVRAEVPRVERPAVELPRAEAPGGARWLWPVILGLALLSLLWWLLGRSHAPRVGEETVTPAPTVALQTPAATFVAHPKLGPLLARPLPNGTQLNIPQGGMEFILLSFIEDQTKPADPNTWFDFDRLLFETGSATLKPESQEQLRNVAEILKAYPTAKAKVGGYTDNSGDAAANLKLSQDRATNV